MLDILDAVALCGLLTVAFCAYALFVAYSAAKEAGGDIEKRNRLAWLRLREDCSRSIAAAKAWAVAAWGVVSASISEHLPLMRSRAISGAFVQKLLTILPFAVPAVTENRIIAFLCILGSAAMFARIVHGRVNASGPLRTPRDQASEPLVSSAALDQRPQVMSLTPRTFPT